MTDSCPPECKVELGHIQDSIDRIAKNHTRDVEEIKAMEVTQWEEIAKRPKYGPLLWFAGITVVVLGALLGAIYTQGLTTHDDVVGLKIQAERIETNLENHMENSRNDRAGNNPYGG
jgi:hypothetical protein